ncbi:hypothetical protein IWX64_002282 [Arthrobacter sp. CAN_A212]|uniref:DUF6194 family protein n=1 Tax=Arthrobacter sp. CAN_A212 TaxID=2787719 RepID=UPI0018CBBD15
MEESEIIEIVSALPGVVSLTASAADGSPESAWGDTFFFYDPDGDTPDTHRFPFATIVGSNYKGFDEASNLDRPGVFRVNVAVGRSAFETLFGRSPKDAAEHLSDHDVAASDVLFPHPNYASQAWVSVINPAQRTSAELRPLLELAHDLARNRYDPRG